MYGRQHRAMFRPNLYHHSPDPSRKRSKQTRALPKRVLNSLNPFGKTVLKGSPDTPNTVSDTEKGLLFETDVQEVWFAGCHSVCTPHLHTHDVPMRPRMGEGARIRNRRRRRKEERDGQTDGGRKGKEARNVGTRTGNNPSHTHPTNQPTPQQPTHRPKSGHHHHRHHLRATCSKIARNTSTDIHHSPPNDAAPRNAGFKPGGHILLWK